MTKFRCSTVVCAVVLSAPVHAQNAGSWSGPYFGASVVKSSSNFHWTEEFSTTAQEFDISASGAKVFAGYNFALEGWIIGAEVSLSSNEASRALTGVDGPGEIDAKIGPSVNLIARAGRPFGDVLPYAFAGVSRSSLETFYEFSTPEGPRGSDHIGTIYGVGVDYRINETMFLRAEVAHSRFESKTYSYCDPSCIADQDFSTTEVSLGLGISF